MEKLIKLIKKYLRHKSAKKFAYLGINVYPPINMKKISRPEKIYLGDYSSIGDDIVMYATENSKIVIGEGTIIAPRCKILTSNHNYNSEDLMSIPFDNRNFVKDVIIEEAVWIGDSVIILSGVTIGKGAVIGSGSVVIKNIPKYAIAVGNPAKVIKYRDEVIFERLLEQKKFNKAINWEDLGGKEFLNK
ncbi:MAG: acyltransferase [Clostridia bacterium]|nr:acyltransferase [Clostridia bacterium]MDD4386493.1 acyltransferase [Clostridia bacterium]